MGVHDKEQYPEVKRLLGIPQDEPIFVIRARDTASVDSLVSYKEWAHNVGASRSFLDGVQDQIDKFMTWRENNRDAVKVPD